MTAPHIAVVFGTRPEAIKMFPLVHALKQHGGFQVSVVVTAQHRELLDKVLQIAEITPDYDLDLMSPEQCLESRAAAMLAKLGKILAQIRPDRVLVHGDTLTTMMAAQASYFRMIPVAHVEAGLRSGNIYSPWPEEISRKVTGTIADLHFAPTERAASSLIREAVPSSNILVTGNTAIDALLHVRKQTQQGKYDSKLIAQIKQQASGKKTVLVTAHRRENHGKAMDGIIGALKTLAETEKIEILFPVHPNPEIRNVVSQTLGKVPNISLLPPLSYPEFVQLIELCDLVLTDSGGIQEEAPTFGKPVLIMRNETERPEVLEVGAARLVGNSRQQIVRETKRLLHDTSLRTRMSRCPNPFGDGRASQRIVARLAEVHGVESLKRALTHVS